MKNRWWLAALAVLSLNLAHALASERLDEMIEQIEEQVEDSEEQRSFTEAVKAYIQERDAALTTLAALVAATGDDAMEAEWESTVDDLSDLPGLENADDGLSSEAALELYDQFMDEEQAWVSALSVLETAAYRDDLVQVRLRLATMTELLEDKWAGLLNDDGQLDEKELRVMADIYGVLAGLARESDTRRKSIRDSIQIVTDLLTKVDVIPSSVPSAITQALGILAEMAKQYNSYKTTLERFRQVVLGEVRLNYDGPLQ